MDEQYHVHDLLAAYVLGAVTPEEAALVEEHLVTCALCRRQEDEFRAVERTLPRLAGEVTPPPALKARLMSIVEAEAPARRSATSATDATFNGARGRPREVPTAGSAAVPTPTAAMPPREIRPRAGFARRRGLPLGPVLALAAALLLVALGVGLWQALGLGAPRPTHTYAFKNLGTLAYYQDGKRLQLDLHGLKPTASNRVYELWLVRLQDGKPVAVKGVKTFRAPGGKGVLTATGQDVRGYNAAALTVERRFSPDKPTPPIVAVATRT